MTVIATGALAGWRRIESDHGSMILELQIARSAEEFRDKEFAKVQVALNERQLRSLARDLARAATDHGLELFSKKRPWWKIWPQRDRPKTPSPRG